MYLDCIFYTYIIYALLWIHKRYILTLWIVDTLVCCMNVNSTSNWLIPFEVSHHSFSLQFRIVRVSWIYISSLLKLDRIIQFNCFFFFLCILFLYYIKGIKITIRYQSQIKTLRILYRKSITLFRRFTVYNACIQYTQCKLQYIYYIYT